MAAPGELKAAIDQMSREFNPAKAKGVNAVVQLNATGEGGGQYAVALADEKANFTEGARKLYRSCPIPILWTDFHNRRNLI